MARHQKSSFRCTPSARKQHVLQRRHGHLLRDFHLKNLREIHAQRVGIPRGHLQRRHGHLLRDFHLKNLREIHAQRVGIPRGADVIQQVLLQPLCTKTWCCTFLTCVFEFRCFETNSCEAPLTLRGRGQTGDKSVRLPETNSPSRHGEAGLERARSGKSRTSCIPDTATMGRPKRAMNVKLAIRRCMRALTC